VPAGVGVMLHFSRLADEWLPIVAAILGSTVLAIAAASWTFAKLMSRRGQSLEESASGR
jgi:holin-like protein